MNKFLVNKNFIYFKVYSTNLEIIKTINETAIIIGLALIIDWIFGVIQKPIWPQGGSVTVSMLCFMVLAGRRGILIATFGAIIEQILFFLYLPTPVINPWQFLLSYVAVYPPWCWGMVLKSFVRKNSLKSQYLFFILMPLIGFMIIFPPAWWTGVLFYSSYNNTSHGLYLYSFIYNITYLLPSCVLCSLIFLSAKKQFLKLMMIKK